MRYCTALLAAAAALVAALGAALAAAPAGAQPPPRTLELSYSGLLNALHLTGDVKVLALHLAEHAGASHFDTHAEMHSYGILRAFKRIDIRTMAEGPVEAGLPQDHTFDFYETRKDGTEKRTLLTWERNAVAHTPPHRAFGNPPPTPAQELAASDPVTQMSRLAYAGGGATICGHSWRFFDGVQLYELQLGRPAADQPTGRERSMGFTQTVACDVRYVEVAGFRHKPGADTGIHSAITARFGRFGGAGGPWIAVSMKADTLLGYAKMQLDTVRVSPG